MTPLLAIGLTGCIFGGSEPEHLSSAERWALLPSVVTLEEPVQTFHGYKADQNAALKDSGQIIRNSIQRSFEDTPASGIDLLGPGFYVAAEPDANSEFYQSRPSLKNQGVLIQVPLLKGSRLLMLEADIDSETSREPNLAGTVKKWMREPESFNKKKALIRDLNLDGIVYTWGGTFTHPLCPEALPASMNPKNFAFLLLNPDAIDWKNLVTVTEQRASDPAAADPKVEQTRQTAYRFIHDRYARHGRDLPLGIQSNLDPLWTNEQFNSYIQKNIFGCRGFASERSSLETWANEQEAKIRERWQEAIRQGRAQGIDVTHIATIMAPRFINTPDWEKALSQNISHPNRIYEPAPTTWNQWQSVTDKTIEKFESTAKLSIALADVQDWNRNALLNTIPEWSTAGAIKSTNNYGKNIKKEKALSQSGIRSIQEKGLGWIPLTCAEDAKPILNFQNSANEECRDIFKYASKHQDEVGFWSKTYQQMKQGLYQNEWYWFACWPKASENSLTQCGAVVYPEPKQIQTQLESIINDANRLTSDPNFLWSQTLTALLLQERTVALHPFDKGNGRVSRWLMDIATSRAELPPIHFKDMDQDLSTSLRQLVIESIQRMAKAVESAEKCLSDPSERQSLKCQVL